MATLDTYVSNTYFRSRSGSKHVKDAQGKYVDQSMYESITARVSPVFKPLTFAITAPTLGPSEMVTPSLVNKLYGKLREELIGSKGELLTSTVEWKTSLDMISGRARTIGSAFLAVKKFQFVKAAQILGIATPSRYKNLSKKAAKAKKILPTSVWLEYWMGWAPLAGDIAHAIKTLADGPKETHRHFRVGVRRQVDEITKTGSPVELNYQITKTLGSVSLSAYGDVVEINHNYQLANRLGFTNPALTLWQTLPFSFMVDWFANVGTVIGSLTDFNSLSFFRTGTAMKSEGDVTASGHQWVSYPLYKMVSFQQNGHYERKYRQPGSLPSPQLHIKMLDKLSLTRAATSVSLLVEIFLRKN